MKHRPVSRKLWPVIVLLLVLLVGLWRGPVAAQSVTNLQADLYQLRQEVNQLRSQVAHLSRQVSGRSTTPRAPRPSGPAPELSDRQMLDRLAVLAIEAKDRLNDLENRVTQLEQRP